MNEIDRFAWEQGHGFVPNIFPRNLGAQRRDYDALAERAGKLREAVCLLNSMVASGESHSATSRAIVAEALTTLDSATSPTGGA